MTKKEKTMQWIFKNHIGYNIIEGGRYLQETNDSYFLYECSICKHEEKVDTPNHLPKPCPECGAVEWYKETKKQKRARYG